MDLAYQDFCKAIRTAAKNSIPRGRRNHHIPFWDAECENLYQTFLQSPEGSDSNWATTALLLRLDKKRRDRWPQAVQIIDFALKPKSMEYIEQPTGRSRHSPRHCAISANAIASPLIRNGRHEGIDRESSRLISQKESDIWRATSTSPVNISESFFYLSGVRCCPQTPKTRKSSRPRFYLPGANSPCRSCNEVLVV